MCSSDWTEELLLAGHWQGHNSRDHPIRVSHTALAENTASGLEYKIKRLWTSSALQISSMMMFWQGLRDALFWLAVWQPEPTHWKKDACVSTNTSHLMLQLFGMEDINYSSFSQKVQCLTSFQCEVMLGCKWLISSSKRSWGTLEEWTLALTDVLR